MDKNTPKDNDNDDYGAELDAVIQKTEKELQKKTKKKTFLQNCISDAQEQKISQTSQNLPKTDEKQQMQFPFGEEGLAEDQMKDLDEKMKAMDVDGVMKQLFQAAMQLPDDDSHFPNLFPMPPQAQNKKDNPQEVAEAQKILDKYMKDLQDEASKFVETKIEQQKKPENQQHQNLPQQQNKQQDFGDLGQMFQNFEKIAEQSKKSNNQPKQAEGFEQLFGGIMNDKEGTPDDAAMMDMLKGLFSQMGTADAQGNPEPSEDLFKDFTNFLKQAEGDEDMNSALQSLVKGMVSKDSLYTPMKVLKDEFPNWLENNWQGLSDQDLERYNKQHDKVVEICEHFEKNSSDDVFELLGQLQELGQPPEELMKKVQAAGLPEGVQPNLDEQIPPELAQLFAGLANFNTPEPSQQTNQQTRQQNTQEFKNPFEGL